jgi:hypothetical protein
VSPSLEASVVAAQEAFYAALTTGDEKAMASLFAPDHDEGDDHDHLLAPEVSGVVASGGRLDDWRTCLRFGSRPEGLVAFDHDATVLVVTSLPSATSPSSTDTSTSTSTSKQAFPLPDLPHGDEVMVAVSTCLESLPGGGTNLATKRWVRRSQCGMTSTLVPSSLSSPASVVQQQGSGECAWRLVLHSTIPYSSGFGAGGLLRCDCRGCVALVAART